MELNNNYFINRPVIDNSVQKETQEEQAQLVSEKKENKYEPAIDSLSSLLSTPRTEDKEKPEDLPEEFDPIYNQLVSIDDELTDIEGELDTIYSGDVEYSLQELESILQRLNEIQDSLTKISEELDALIEQLKQNDGQVEGYNADYLALNQSRTSKGKKDQEGISAQIQALLTAQAQ